LKAGEHLRAFNGTPIVRRVVPLADPEPVFNLEVQCDHVYHVAKNGVLVHNALDDCFVTLFKAPRSSYDAARMASTGLDQAAFSGGAYFTTRAEVAHQYARTYVNGVLEFRIPRAQFDDMVAQGKIVIDTGEQASFRVLPEFLDEFNSVTAGSRRWIEQTSEDFWRIFGAP
jgi:hypothetical protein